MPKDATSPIYESDSDAAPDDEFEPGRLCHLVVGNHGRLLDPRRTPITVVGVDLAVGMFDLEVGAFEDAGARWRVALEDVARFQFHLGERHASDSRIARYEASVKRFGRTLEIEINTAAAASTRQRLANERAACARDLDKLRVPPCLDPGPFVRRRAGSADLAWAVQLLLTERDLLTIDEAFVTQYVSNPWSGELIKGHAIVAAELGLVPYRGNAVRSPGLFDGGWSKTRRAEHLLVRLAITAELWRRCGGAEVTLYRAVSSETAVRMGARHSFVSATFSPDVASEHFSGGRSTRSAAMYRQAVPVERLLMTFLETPGMDAPFAEAEAILVGTDAGLF